MNVSSIALYIARPAKKHMTILSVKEFPLYPPVMPAPGEAQFEEAEDVLSAMSKDYLSIYSKEVNLSRHPVRSFSSTLSTCSWIVESGSDVRSRYDARFLSRSLRCAS